MRQVPTNKTLIALLYWEKDKPQAMKLARLLADLEPGHSEEADILFVARFDCKHDDQAIQYVSRKFNVFKHTSKRRGEGWPLGCNSIFFGMLEWVYYKMASAQVPHYKNVLIIASDGAPLASDWISRFQKKWIEVNAARPTYVAGALILDPANGHDHINGDACMLSGDLKFLKWLTLGVGDVSVVAGWDWVLSSEFARWGWCDFPFVKSVWNRPVVFTQKDWDEETQAGTVWFHGQKGSSLLDLARKNLLTV